MDTLDIFNRIKGDKARVCKLGETAVIQKLTELGWDAFNANSTNPNYKGVDIICVNPKNLNTLFIQVKSSAESEPNFPTGLVSDTKGFIGDQWEKQIVGPWIFVHIKMDDGRIVYKYYILTKKEVVQLIGDSNSWYWSQPKRNAKNPKQPIGLPISWITGECLSLNSGSFRGYPRNIEIESCEDGWDKIGMPE